MATSSSPLAALHSSSFASSTPSLPCKLAAPPRRRRPYTRIRAIDLDQNTIVAISVGVVSIAVGIGVPVFYETQIDNAKSQSLMPCFFDACSQRGRIHSRASPAAALARVLRWKGHRYCSTWRRRD
ncbi:protein SPA, chloroplastic isoform X2 [Panicum hallii]|uniref:protein SPA, chloroplastic isoform X2 n=1 Tax=Panicum hallii TaxID=206008 RepID=UPI000DF4EF1C|nr:protein SPA, chloroplastic isoform X2 [Panicum hallii]